MNHSITSLFLFSAILLVSLTHATPSDHQPKLQQTIKQAQSCRVNICYVLDGSNTLSASDFELQGDFVAITAATIPANTPGVSFSAVQVANRAIPITGRTGSVSDFLLSIDRTGFANARRSSLAPGAAFCREQFAGRPAQANKIVVITNGRGLSTSNIGGGAGEVCAVGVGNRDFGVLSRIAGGDRSKVLTVSNTVGFLNIIERLVRDECRN